MKNILSLNNDELKEFFLKHESYINFDLPPYINFNSLLQKISNDTLGKEKLSYIQADKPEHYENVNYKLFHNKNGKYDWRKFELINPFIYVSLVHEIATQENWKLIKNRLNNIKAKSVVQCMSLPIVSESNQSDKAAQITNWWKQIEQKSLKLSLDYSCVYHTDITDCYGSIYTHSIAWALHSKKTSKYKRQDRNFKKNYVGGVIDCHIQKMANGQTNGIPQGSVLMDFIAEIVLSYADLCLSVRLKHIKKSDFKILRYRDDYRIFVNNPQLANEIIKLLTEVLINLGLRLNSEKTNFSNNIIQSSIKQDKIGWLVANKYAKTTQKQLLIIHQFALRYPNSGTIVRELQTLSKKIRKNKEKIKKNEDIEVLVSIIIDIALLNPRTYSISMAVVSILFGLLEQEQTECIVNKIINKFNAIPNTGHMQIWLQRATIKLRISKSIFDESLCKLINNESTTLWNNSWLHRTNQNLLNNRGNIIQQDILDGIDIEIQNNEVLLFGEHSL
jgi:RNA-directed DNA polymerase